MNAATSNLIAVRIACIRYEAQAIVSLELAPLDGAGLPPFTAGAHIDLHLPNGMVRNYSLLSLPDRRDCYVIGVLRDRHSRGGSLCVHQDLRVGMQIGISAPRNNFPLDEAAAHSVLVAGGIGVTPMVCMLGRLRQLGKSAEVFYAARSRSEAAFLQHLPAGIEQHLHFDEEQGGPPDLRAYLAAKPADAHFYCCGPLPMIEAFEHACAELGLQHVHVERFTAKAAKVGQDGAYRVVLARSGRTLGIPAGGVLLDSLLAAGVQVEHSCREGVCGSCETRVLRGIPQHRDAVLSKSEQAANTSMMVCVSGCASEELVLDL